MLFIKGNARTHLLDCSNIYGSLPETAASLREFKKGKLKINNQQILPQKTKEGNSECDYDCYFAGSLFIYFKLLSRNIKCKVRSEG